MDIRRALSWVRDGYSHRLWVLDSQEEQRDFSYEKELFRLGFIDSHGEITEAGRAFMETGETNPIQKPT